MNYYCVMLTFSCELLHAFYFYVKHFCVLIKPVALPAMGWACPYHLSSFDTRIFSKYRDTENVQFWGSQQNQSNCHM